ncbi:MAG: hypothetical protein A2351_02880 [Omnitrophica bacterium RIFOXYB12_FULL_50_7]|nr:MAG: hypothetical protein A2351_02880 [Omnitrophica bacterium RIFOXYB12_FULL_50_7]
MRLKNQDTAVKVIAILALVVFLYQNVVWANPEYLIATSEYQPETAASNPAPNISRSQPDPNLTTTDFLVGNPSLSLSIDQTTSADTATRSGEVSVLPGNPAVAFLDNGDSNFSVVQEDESHVFLNYNFTNAQNDASFRISWAQFLDKDGNHEPDINLYYRTDEDLSELLLTVSSEETRVYEWVNGTIGRLKSVTYNQYHTTYTYNDALQKVTLSVTGDTDFDREYVYAFDPETKTIGEIQSSARIAKSTPFTFTKILNPGWNFFSIPFSESLNANSFKDKYRINSIYEWSNSAGSYTFADTIEYGKGYWINVNQETVITLTSNRITNLDTPLSKGWNLIGAPSVEAPLANIQGLEKHVGTIWGWSGSGYVKVEGGAAMTPGAGYWFYLREAINLRYFDAIPACVTETFQSIPENWIDATGSQLPPEDSYVFKGAPADLGTSVTFNLTGPEGQTVQVIFTDKNRNTFSQNVVLTSAEQSVTFNLTSGRSNFDSHHVTDVTFKVLAQSGTAGTVIFETNGLKAPNTQLLSPALVNQTNYTFEYELNGTHFSEPKLLTEGKNVFLIRDNETLDHEVLARFEVTLDIQIPVGSLNINSGSVYSDSLNVTLNLSASDAAGSGLDTMSFSTDNVNWTTPEAYATTKAWTLLSGDGLKTVYVKFIDKAGNVSIPYSQFITLDTEAPSGSITINGENPYSITPLVTLTLSGADVGSGVDQMRFSIDAGVAWTDWETYQTTKSITLPGDYGKKEVRAQFKDRVNNVGEFLSSIFYGVGAYLADQSLSYFTDATKLAVEPISGYPHEGYNQRDYTQPTNIGFYSLLMANIASGQIQTDKISQATALANLSKVMTSLLADQARLGYKGLLPWFQFNGSTWNRDPGLSGQQVVLGDNTNLSAALGAVIGALLDPVLVNDATAQAIRTQIESFLDAQKAGYDLLYDSAKGQFRDGMYILANPNSPPSYMPGYQDSFGSEFRAGTEFLMLRFNYADSVYSQLVTDIVHYSTQAGSDLYVAKTWDGGAFQMLWPTLLMPETDIPALSQILQNFVTAALDFSNKNNLPGFLSASYCSSGYCSTAGIDQLSMNTVVQNERATSLYTLGAAHMIKPLEVEQFLDNILKQYPSLLTSHGLWEGYDKNTSQIVQEQIVTNVATFVLGMAGTGPLNMTRYLQSRNLWARFQTVTSQQAAPMNVLASATGGPWNWSGSGRYYRAYQFASSNLNLAGRRIIIKYKSTAALSGIFIELKRGSSIASKLYLDFLNTNNTEQTITIDIPPLSGFSGLYEMVFNSGSSLNGLTLTSITTV